MSATSFWIGLMSTPDSKLVRADIAKLAERHQIPVDWARYWFATWLERDR